MHTKRQTAISWAQNSSRLISTGASPAGEAKMANFCPQPAEEYVQQYHHCCAMLNMTPDISWFITVLCRSRSASGCMQS